MIFEGKDRETWVSQSRNGEVYVPIAVAAIPLGLFTLLGFIGRGIGKNGAEQTALVVAMLVVQFLGMIAMAVVFLIRYDLVTQELHARTDGKPRFLRRLSLKASLASLLVFDILTNVAAAFSAGFLFFGSVPVFVAYILLNRLAFANLRD